MNANLNSGVGLAQGGQIKGPGGPKSDAVPIMASDGEYIVNAKAASQFKDLLDAINFGPGVKGYAMGGPVMSPQSPIVLGAGGSPPPGTAAPGAMGASPILTRAPGLGGVNPGGPMMGAGPGMGMPPGMMQGMAGMGLPNQRQMLPMQGFADGGQVTNPFMQNGANPFMQGIVPGQGATPAPGTAAPGAVAGLTGVNPGGVMQTAPTPATFGLGSTAAQGGKATLPNIFGAGGAQSNNPAMGAGSFLNSIGSEGILGALQGLQNHQGGTPQPGPTGTTSTTGAVGSLASNPLFPGQGVGGYGALNAPFGQTTAALAQTPGYQFQLQQGDQGILNAASATGSVQSGNTLKALGSYNQGLASTDYQQALTNYMNQQSQAFNQQYDTSSLDFSQQQSASQDQFSDQLSAEQVAYNQALQAQQQQFNQSYDLASLSENAAAGLGSTSAAVGQSIGSDITGAGNALAAGTVGSSNAIGNALTGSTSSLSNALLLQSLLGTGASGAGFGTLGTLGTAGASSFLNSLYGP